MGNFEVKTFLKVRVSQCYIIFKILIQVTFASLPFGKILLKNYLVSFHSNHCGENIRRFEDRGAAILYILMENGQYFENKNVWSTNKNHHVIIHAVN